MAMLVYRRVFVAFFWLGAGGKSATWLIVGLVWGRVGGLDYLESPKMKGIGILGARGVPLESPNH